MTRSLTEINSAIARQLAETIGEDRFDMWFGGPESFRVSEGKAVIVARDDLTLAFLQQQFSSAIRQAITSVVGDSLTVSWQLAAPDASSIRQTRLFSSEQLAEAGLDSDQGESAVKQRKPKRLRRTGRQTTAGPEKKPVVVDPQHLDHFHFGPDNLLLATAVKQVLSHPGKFNPLVLHGPVGSGKSHLLRGMVEAARRQTAIFRRCVCLTSEQFTTGFIDGLQGNGLPLFRAKYRQLDLLALDDIQFLSGKKATIVEFQNTIESLLQAGKQILVSADRPVHELDFLGESLMTRLSCGMSCPVAWPDLDARKKIAADYVQHHGIRIDSETVDVVCQQMGRDVRMLQGALNRVHAASLATSQPVTPSAVCELLADMFHCQSPVISLQRIERVVCDICGVRPEELKSAKRIKRISTARMLAIWLSRRHTTAGLAEIGDYYGGRNHSTIVAARKKIDALNQADAEIDINSRKVKVSDALARLENRLRAG